MKVILSLASLVLLCTVCKAQFIKGGYELVGHTLPYQISYPVDYDSSKQYPLIVFLHGSGERGNDNEAQLVHGKDFFLNNTQSKFPAIVIAPQCPAESSWSNMESNNTGKSDTFNFEATDEATSAMICLEGLINNWIKSGKIDTKRVYVGGLSLGGMGTLEILWRMPNTFAAAFPICGGGSLSKAPRYAKNTAVWLFYGEADPVVPTHCSTDMYKTLKENGCDVKITGYPGVGHNSWDNVFQSTELFPWLFSHSK